MRPAKSAVSAIYSVAGGLNFGRSVCHAADSPSGEQGQAEIVTVLDELVFQEMEGSWSWPFNMIRSIFLCSRLDKVAVTL